MAFALKEIQEELQRRKLDGWLLYDIWHRDPIAYRVLGLEATMVKRRWFYLIPATGVPQKLAHRVEPAMLDSLPGDKHLYSAWGELRGQLALILGSTRKIAMQYSPLNNIPSVSLVDAGTIELVRSLEKEVVSSADLVQQFESRWSPEQAEMHRQAGKLVDEVMRATFKKVADSLRAGTPLTEYSLQQWIMEQFDARGLTTDDPPIVAVNANSGNPHYEPRAQGSPAIKPGDWLLLDMWAKLRRPGAVYYDITWVGFLGEQAPARQREIFHAVREARDAAVRFVVESVGRRQPIRGFQVDDAARNVIRAAGYGDFFVHRTGHSIGEDVHGSGANMDNLETHDDREIISGTCFSVEPGIYLPEFGVRTEVNVYVGEKSAGTTGDVQKEIVLIQA